jgi:hypothetical protein
MLHDTLELPDFTAEENWTSSLRSRAGFSKYGREVSDFTYKDTQGALTRHLLQMPHHYAVPEWLASACSNGNVPLYRLEVKSTTSQAHNTPFYMSGAQYRLVGYMDLCKIFIQLGLTNNRQKHCKSRQGRRLRFTSFYAFQV